MSTEVLQPENPLSNPKSQSENKKANESIRSIRSTATNPKKTVASHLEDIFQEPKRPSTANIDIEKRFYEYKEKVNKKIEGLKQQKEAEDKELCTFRPKTSLPASEDRKFSHFLDHMTTVNENKKKNLEKLKNDRENEEAKEKAKFFKPTLTKKTQKLASKNKSASDLHEKLFKESEELKKKKETESQALIDQICSFKPTVDKMSQVLKRDGKATQRLYEEAKKKKDKIKNEEPKPVQSENLISEESKNIIREKFLKEISEDLAADPLGFPEFTQMLLKHGFVKAAESIKNEEEKNLPSKAWKTLEESEESKTTPEKIKNFLLGVMNLTKKEEGNTLKIHRDFQILFENRKKSQIKSEEVVKPAKTCTFTPRINKISKDLAKGVKGLRKTAYGVAKPEVVLNMISQEEKKKLEEKRNKNESEDLKPCTFKPVTLRGPKIADSNVAESYSISSDYFRILSEKPQHRCDMLHDFSKVEQEKKLTTMRSIEDCELEKNMTECTFTPNLEKKLQKPEPEKTKKQKVVYKSPPLNLKTQQRKETFVKKLTGFSNSSDGQSYLSDMIKNFLEK